MNRINRSIEKFCYKHPHFGIPNLVLILVIASAVSYLIYMMDTTNTYLSLIMFSPYHILRGQVWRLITWVLCPLYLRPISLLIALYFYYFIGSTLERQWGKTKFTVYFLFGMVLYIVFGFVVYFISGKIVYLDASYLYLSMFFAFATYYPDQRVLLFFIIPIKIKWLALIDAALFIYAIVTSGWPSMFLPILAFVTYFVICGDELISYLKYSGIIKPKTSNTINFKRAVKNSSSKEEKKPYRYKCAVCGRTDTDNPGLEFRYCSRCQGYHCFCIDHINSHIHFTE